jgi:single-strand DNA-binding protein
VVGRLKQDRWTDQTGKPHSKVKVVAEHVEFKPIFKPADATDTEEGEAPAQQTESRIREAEPVF